MFGHLLIPQFLLHLPSLMTDVLFMVLMLYLLYPLPPPQSYELLMKCPYFFLDVFYAHETPSQKNECHVSAHFVFEFNSIPVRYVMHYNTILQTSSLVWPDLFLPSIFIC